MRARQASLAKPSGQIGALVAMCEAIDKELQQVGSRGRKALLDIRLRASGRLERWLREFVATPSSRAAWARDRGARRRCDRGDRGEPSHRSEGSRGATWRLR